MARQGVDVRDDANGPTVTLDELRRALDTAVSDSIYTPAQQPALASVMLLTGPDLADETPAAAGDLVLLAGVDGESAARWLDEAAVRGQLPGAVLAKIADDSPLLIAATTRAKVALVSIDPRARWDQVLATVTRLLDRTRRHHTNAESPDVLGADADLFGLAQTLARNTGGMVSIEDEHARVLAYSASDQSADELRIRSILGRAGPPDYLRALREWGVYDRLRKSDDVVEVPEQAELAIKRRLVVSIRRAVGCDIRTLGSIWVQQGNQPLREDAGDILRGGAAIAARIMWRNLTAPTTEAQLIQRLLGARGDGVDVPTVAATLGLPSTGAAAVVGFALHQSKSDDAITTVGTLVRLHASAYRADAVAAVIDGRAYALLPHFRSERSVQDWAGQLIQRIETRHTLILRAAIALPIADLARVAAARAEVDRVLDGTAAAFPLGRVTTLAKSLTPVLLGEIVALITAHPELHDPRLRAVVEYDREHSANLCESVAAYLAAHGDVRAAAGALHVHPNTLRYRVRRVEEIAGVDLGNAADRLLLELQLAVRGAQRVADVATSARSATARRT